MSTGREREIIDLAVAEGLLTPDRIARMEREVAEDPTVDLTSIRHGPHLDRMIAAGMLEERAVCELAARARPSQQPPQVQPDQSGWSRYQIIELIGHGGMGRVFRAFDRMLERHVALKLIKSSSPLARELLIREARLQAKVEHDAVCQIFDVGEIDGQAFIAMQLIHHGTLREQAGEIALRDRIRVIATIARAVHAAHEAGLVHLDLKPSNVMLERSADGWKPFVLDFGIARDTTAATSVWPDAGTPRYMAPEQIRGDTERLDRRTDVYALGVILGELCGHSVSPMVNRCVAEREDRYPTALELAEDLERHLSRSSRRRLRIAALAALSVIVGLSSWGAWEKSFGDHQAALAQRFGQYAEQLEAELRYAKMLPLHDVSPEVARVKGELSRLIEEIEVEGGPAFGPGHHAIGRVYLSIGDLDRARAHLSKSWESGYRVPAVAAALGRTLGSIYEREAIEERPEDRARLERDLRDPAIELLARAASADPMAAALVAFYSQRHPEALAECEKAASLRPWEHAVPIMKGRIHAERARAIMEQGDQEAAAVERAEALSAFEAASSIARSDSEPYAQACRVWTDEVYVRTHHTKLDATAAHAHAIAQCDRALTAAPALPLVLAELSRAHKLLAIQKKQQGGDPIPHLTASAEAAERGLSLDPDDAHALNSLGNVYRIRGELESERGLDAAATFARATELLARATDLAPGLPYLWNNRGNADAALAKDELRRGLDPRLSIERALERYARATAIDAGHPSPYVNSADVLMMLARKRDLGAIRRAGAFIDRALALNPSDPYALELRRELEDLGRVP